MGATPRLGIVLCCKATISKVACTAVPVQGQTLRNRTEQNRTECPNTDPWLEGMRFVMTVAFQTGGRCRIDCLTNVSGIIKGKIVIE